MSKLRLTIATTDYDHFRDFRLGTVQAEGIDTVWSMLGHHEIFARMTFNREWDASELSFAKFCAQVTRKDSDLIGLPVVCSRLFRFSSFYVNKKSKIRTAKDLKGKTIGSPEWAHTAAVYMRGWLNDEHGVGLKDINWVQAGANEPGRIEKVELNLPKGVKLTRIKDKSLSEMVASGEIDCALIAPMFGSRLCCSKNIHCSVSARSMRSVGARCDWPATYQRIAFDSAMKRLGATSSSGTWPFGFLAMNSGVRVSPCRMSISTSSCAMPSCASASRTL